jgi:hypothetical protein
MTLIDVSVPLDGQPFSFEPARLVGAPQHFSKNAVFIGASRSPGGETPVVPTRTAVRFGWPAPERRAVRLQG